MGMPQWAWGIDIGDHALKAVRLVRADSKLKVDDFELVVHERPLSQAGDRRGKIVRASLNILIERHATQECAIAVGLSGAAALMRFAALPPMDPRKYQQLIKFEAAQQIPFPLKEVEWAYTLFHNPQASEVAAGFYAARHEVLNELVGWLDEVGLSPDVIQLTPLAGYNALYHEGVLRGPTLILDIGAQHTELIISDGERVWPRSIAVGGQQLTRLLGQTLNLEVEEAEALKQRFATSKRAGLVIKAMEPGFAELATEAQRSMGFYGSAHPDTRLRRLVVIGGTARLAGLAKYLGQRLQLDPERPTSVSAGAPDDSHLASVWAACLPALLPAYGLALQAMGKAKVNISLLPGHVRRTRALRAGIKWLLVSLLVAVILAVVAGVGWFAYTRFAAV